MMVLQVSILRTVQSFLILLPVVQSQYYPVNELEGVTILHHGSQYNKKDGFKFDLAESRLKEQFDHSGSHIAPVKVGPYRPWSFPPEHLTKKISVGGKDYGNGYEPAHPGYHTNIIIDPYAKESSIVQIRTEDLSTGLTVGETSWSGPGTLTLSALSSLIGGAGVLLSNPPDTHKVTRDGRNLNYDQPTEYLQSAPSTFVKHTRAPHTYTQDPTKYTPAPTKYTPKKYSPTPVYNSVKFTTHRQVSAPLEYSTHFVAHPAGQYPRPVTFQHGLLSKDPEANEDADAEWVTVPTKHEQVDAAEWVTGTATHQLAKHSDYQPHESLRVLGKACQTDYECSPALNSVCGYNSLCKVTNSAGCYQYTCQCPPNMEPITNRYNPSNTSNRHSRSLRYHQECRQIRK